MKTCKFDAPAFFAANKYFANADAHLFSGVVVTSIHGTISAVATSATRICAVATSDDQDKPTSIEQILIPHYIVDTLQKAKQYKKLPIIVSVADDERVTIKHGSVTLEASQVKAGVVLANESLNRVIVDVRGSRFDALNRHPGAFKCTYIGDLAKFWKELGNKTDIAFRPRCESVTSQELDAAAENQKAFGADLSITAKELALSRKAGIVKLTTQSGDLITIVMGAMK